MPQQLPALERYKHYLSICSSAASERLAVITFKNRDKILEHIRSLFKSNLAELDQFFSESPQLFEWEIPDGGWVGYPRFIGRGGIENLCHRLTEEAGILILPSSIYNSELMPTPTDHLRVGFGRKGIEAGLDAFRGFLHGKHNEL